LVQDDWCLRAVGEHFTMTVYRRQLSKDRFNEEMETTRRWRGAGSTFLMQMLSAENSNFYRGRKSSRPGSQYEVIKYGTCASSVTV
jgi:hypothetical protein